MASVSTGKIAILVYRVSMVINENEYRFVSEIFFGIVSISCADIPMSNTHIHMSENNYFTSSRARGLFLSKVMMGTASYAGDSVC